LSLAQPLGLRPWPSLTNSRNTNRVDRAIRRRHGEALLGHQLANQRGRLRTLHRRLDADADQALGVVERLPREAGNRRAGDVRVTAAAVAQIELRTAIDQQLDDLRAALECGAHQR